MLLEADMHIRWTEVRKMIGLRFFVVCQIGALAKRPARPAGQQHGCQWNLYEGGRNFARKVLNNARRKVQILAPRGSEVQRVENSEGSR